jgi:regulator of protease activity HflC (stomatin/prohibitin superfamily)
MKKNFIIGGMIIGGIVVVLITMVWIFFNPEHAPSLVDVILGIIILLLIGLIYFILLPILKRVLSDIPLFWIRMKENYGAVILKDGKINKIYISTTDEDKRYFEKFKTNPRYHFIQPGAEVQWFGCSWNGYEVSTQNELSEDLINPIADPQNLINLQRQTFNWRTSDVDTSDPIQVFGRIIFIMRIVDVEKYVFKTRIAQEEVKNRLLGVWREVIATLSYLKESEEGGADEDSKVKSMTKNEELQKAASKEFCKKLGYTDEDGNKNDESKYVPGTFAYAMVELGIHVYEIKLDDIDPSDSSIREALNEKIKARARALAKIEDAKGEATAKFLKQKKEADGMKYQADKTGISSLVLAQMENAVKVSGNIKDMTVVGSSADNLGHIFNDGLVRGKGYQKSKKFTPTPTDKTK